MVLHLIMRRMRLTRNRGCSIERRCLLKKSKRLFFFRMENWKKLQMDSNAYLLFGRFAPDFPSLSQILTSSTNFMSSAVGLIRWWILFERSMFEILTATVINLSGITKLSNLLRSQWFLGPTCQTQESPAPACPAVCWVPLPPPSPPACCSWDPC